MFKKGKNGTVRHIDSIATGVDANAAGDLWFLPSYSILSKMPVFWAVSPFAAGTSQS
ncbi:hypothetical protein [Marimonas arenosa]|uniref:Uncharacterized protein n=1 Tax=Marimonas arenosa TaxID=1795305 RepID=A0AAE4B773_9RHOB|nr:hypothetical protein [Marimonas arenosa]MDQ2092074.1 hypothetical protein [Marimonas arenosa]